MNEFEDLELNIQRRENKFFAPSSALAASPVTVDEQFQSQLESIPDRMAFKIGDVAKIADVKPYVLRYWEAEFEVLKPEKSKHNQRIYTRKDVETILMIKKLLYKDRFSIEGARSALGRLKKEKKKASALKGVAIQLEDLRDDAQDLLISIRHLRERFESMI